MAGLLATSTPVPAVESLDRPPSAAAAADAGFVDVADEVGLDFRHGAFRWDVAGDPPAMLGGGVCWLDHDGDGWLDLFAVNSYSLSEAGRWRDRGGVPRSALFRNVGGRFEDVGAGSGADLEVRGNGCVAADFDRDGRTDLYVTTATRGHLLWNEGGGSFVDRTEEAGLEAFGWHAGAAVGDIDGDGWPDLFLAGYADLNNPVPTATQGFPNTYQGVRDLLYLSDGVEDGSLGFREVGLEAGLEASNFDHGLGAVLSDFDRDGDLDIYVANDTRPNRLYENVGWPGGARADPSGLGFRFEEVAARAGVADPNSGMGIALGDYDGDGRSDLFVTNAHGQLHAAFRAEGSATITPSFVDSRADFDRPLGGSTGWGASWADIDLDTDLDLLFVTGGIPVTDLARDGAPIEAFENRSATAGAVRLEDARADLGLDQIGPLLARGSAAADYDNDGDIDFAVNRIGGELVLLENTATGGNSLMVRLQGFHPGARVTAVLPDGRRVYREVQAGSSYLSSEDPRIHLGLGAFRRIDRLVVEWPGGRRTVISDLAANQIVSVGPSQ